MTEAERQQRMRDALQGLMGAGGGFSSLPSSSGFPSSPSVTPRNPMAEMILNVLRSLQEATGIEGKTVSKAARGAQDLTLSAVQNLPEPFKKPLRQAVGRVATNIIEPFGYPGKAEEAMGGFAPGYIANTVSSIIKDQPSRWVNATRDEIIEARRPLFREYFDLDPQDTKNMYIKDGKNYRINPATKQVIVAGTLQEFGDESKQKGAEYPLGSKDPMDFLGPMRGNAISGEYMPGHPDPWNFDLSARELEAAKGRPLTKSEFGRSFFEAIGRPAILDTRDPNPPPKENNPIPKEADGPPLASNSLTSRDLRQFPPWMRDILRTTPDYPKAERPGTHQADPRMVPIIPIDPAGNRAFDPTLGRSDAMMLAYLNNLMGLPRGGGDEDTRMFQPIANLIQALAGGQT